MNKEELSKFYKDITEEMSTRDFLKLVEDGKIKKEAPVSEYICFDFFPGTPEGMGTDLYNVLKESDCTWIIGDYPEQLYEKLYFLLDDGGNKSIVCKLLPGTLNQSQFEMEYPKDGMGENCYLDNFVDLCTSNLGNKTEKYDPEQLGYTKTQAMVDETEKQYENGEITYGEMAKKFGWANDETYKREHVDALIEIAKTKELRDVFLEIIEGDMKISEVELKEFEDEMKKQLPDVQTKFNEEFDDFMKAYAEEKKKEREDAEKAVKEFEDNLNAETWHYEIKEDEKDRYVVIIYAESEKDKPQEERILTSEMVNKVVDIGFSNLRQDGSIGYDHDYLSSMPSLVELESELEKAGFIK